MLHPGITLIILSLIAVPNLILAKSSDAQQLLNKVVPYQGWIGFAFCIWGVWKTILYILNIIYWFPFDYMSMWMIIDRITWLAALLVEAILGFMLGYGFIKYLLSKNETDKAKDEALRTKLATKQGKLGIFGVIVGLLVIILMELSLWNGI